MKLFAIVLSIALVASVSAQDMFSTMMMMNMLRGGSGSSSGQGRGGAAANALAGSSAGGRMNPMMLAMGGDRMRDMMMCNYMPGRSMLRQMCMMRAMQ